MICIIILYSTCERSNFLSQFSKKLVLYLLIIAIAVFAIDSLAGQNTNKAEMSYTGFVQQVQQKKVESVTITNDHGIKGKLKIGTDFVSYAPSDDTLIKTLTDNGVEITAAPPEQPSWWVSLLGSATTLGLLHNKEEHNHKDNNRNRGA